MELENRYDKVCNRLSDMPERRRAEVAGMSELAADAARESPEARCGPNRSEGSAFFGCGARRMYGFFKEKREPLRIGTADEDGRDHAGIIKSGTQRVPLFIAVLRPVANSS